MSLITTNAELLAFCTAAKSAPYITVDTEFMRERTFWAILCLIQIATPDDEAMIDPLVEDLDLAPFYDLLTDENIIKVMHGCRQDIEIFYNEAEVIPTPVYDTQIAAQVCGFGDAVGYETLIRRTINEEIDKTHRFTDWARRPLSPEQLQYAQSDVTLLRGAYEYLLAETKEAGREEWVREEMNSLYDLAQYKHDPEDAWRRFKLRDKRPRVLGALLELSYWRETEAQRKNVPRGRILKDDALRELATQGPKDMKALSQMRGLPHGFAKSKHAAAVLQAVARGRKRTKEDLPQLPKAVVNKPGMAALVDLLKVLQKHCAEEFKVAPKLLGSVADLERIACDDEPQVIAMSGWRYEIFGQHAMALKAGKLAIAAQEDKVLLINR